MAQTSKVNHDHTYDILTSLMNVSPSFPEDKELLLDITSPQPSDTSSDSGLALSPMEFQGLDVDFGENSPSGSFHLETIASGSSPNSTDQLLDNIGDLSDIDLSFLDGLDCNSLDPLPEISEENTQQNKTDTLDFESLIDMVDDGIITDDSADTTPAVVPDLTSCLEPAPQVKQVKMVKTATVTPIVITEIRPAVTFSNKTGNQAKDEQLIMSEEERKLLEEEGHVLPTNVALTKEEEKLLKKVRRKIKNKVSAQESRRKKKEYVDGLEFRVKTCTDQNRVLQKKVDSLEKQNKSLLEQLKTLQELVSTTNRTKKQTSTCILVLFLAFALVAFPFNTFSTHSPRENAVVDSYSTLPVRSRTLLQYNEEPEPSTTLNISHYLRAFSVVFSFTNNDNPDVESYSKPSSVSFNEAIHTNDDSLTKEYSFSK